MDTARDEVQEELLGDIIAQGSDAVLSFLNDTDGLEGEGEEADYGDRTMEEEGHDHDGSDDPMEVQEGDRVNCSGDRTESDQVYIYILCINYFGMYIY